jgi:RNA polymerase-interacting CarD/CdnL/TRCF family regulator
VRRPKHRFSDALVGAVPAVQSSAPVSNGTENDGTRTKKVEWEASRAREEATEIAESSARALSAVHRILQHLLREAHLTEDERQSYAKDLAMIDREVQWMVDGDSSKLR